MEEEKNVETKVVTLKQPVKKKNTANRDEIFLLSGLNNTEVAEQISAHKVNKVPNRTTKSTWGIIQSNIFTVFNFLNFAVAGWLISVGSYKNTIFISLILMNIMIGIIQELKSKKTIDSLSLLNAPTAFVTRNGEVTEIKSEDIVLGDLIRLFTGKEICADSIILAGSIEVNESLLSGESNAIVKKKGDAVYAGSFVVSGEANARVEKVGMDSYIQQLSAQAKKYRRPNSEILNDLTALIKVVTVIIIIMGGVLYVRQIHGGNSYEQAVIGTSGGIIGMIPSGLFFLTSISLAIGVIKLAKYKTLVQDLFCIEMLARVNVLCLDKTGTITDGTMEVKEIKEYQVGKHDVKAIIASIQGYFNDVNPTALALQAKFGKTIKTTVEAVIPFSSSRKFSALGSKKHGVTFLLGAPEFILGDDFSKIATEVNDYASNDYRVLLLASSPTKIAGKDTRFEDIEPIALILIVDTIRPEAYDTIRYFRENDVSVRVISGDNPITVSSIAKRVGIENADKYISLENVSEIQLKKIAHNYTVFGRVSPAQKQMLIKAFKEKGDVVAMTGDGVNDILALKEADCSIAMANGSEAARNVSHLVLMDSNFAALPQVVKEGRRVINNIQKVATLFLTKTVFSFLLCLIVIIQGGNSYPIQTIQLTYYDFPIITIPTYYLALEANMSRIKGNFIFNVLFSALPGALLVGLNYVIIVLLSVPLNMGAAAISATTVLTTAVVGFFVLFAVCQPFNRGRKIVFALSMTVFAVLVFFLHDILEIGELRNFTIANILLILVIAQYSYIVLSFFNRGSMKVKNWIIDFGKYRKERRILKAKRLKAKERKRARMLKQRQEKAKTKLLNKEKFKEKV